LRRERWSLRSTFCRLAHLAFVLTVPAHSLIRRPAAGLRGSAQPLSAGPALQILCSSGVIVPFHLASISAVLPAPPPVTPEVAYSNHVPPARTHAATPAPASLPSAPVQESALTLCHSLSTAAAPPPPVLLARRWCHRGKRSVFCTSGSCPQCCNSVCPRSCTVNRGYTAFRSSASIPSFGGGSLNGGAAFPSFGNSSAGVPSFVWVLELLHLTAAQLFLFRFGGTASLSFPAARRGPRFLRRALLTHLLSAPRKKSSSTAASAEAKPGASNSACQQSTSCSTSGASLLWYW